MKFVGKLKNINLIQFVPLIFVVSLVGNSVLGYTTPKGKETGVGETKEVRAGTNKKSQKVSVGDVDLSKIKDGVYEGTGTGFKGKVKVSVTVKSHKMTDIKVLSNSDDAAYFNRASNGVIQSILSQQSLQVDVVSGATYSSKGIIAAVKNALTGEEDNSAAAGTDSSSGSADDVGTTDESGEYKDGIYTGTGTGFHGIVKVSVAIRNNKIKNIKVLENHDDAAYFNRASGTLIPLMIKRQTTNVDAVSGATYSSNGIIKAVRNALSKAAVKKSKNRSDDNDSSSDTKTENEKNNSASEGVSGTYKDGTYEGTGQGFRGTIKVQISIKDSKITKIQVLSKTDDEPYFTNALGVISSIIAKQNINVDVVSGATYSSKGIVKAVENALKKALVKPEESDNTNTDNSTDQDNFGENVETEGSSVYVGTALCDPDEDDDFYTYNLSLEVVVKDGKMIAIQNVKGSGGENYYALNDIYINSAKTVILPKLLNGDVSVDVVSGATCSSNAIIAAYKNAMSKIQN